MADTPDLDTSKLEEMLKNDKLVVKHQFSKDEENALYNVGVKYMHANDFERAVPIFQVLTACFPMTAKYVKAFAGCMQAKEEYLSAYMTYKLAFLMDPADSNNDCYYYSGICLFKIENFKQAKQEFEGFLESKFDNSDMIARSKLYLEKIETHLTNDQNSDK